MIESSFGCTPSFPLPAEIVTSETLPYLPDHQIIKLSMACKGFRPFANSSKIYPFLEMIKQEPWKKDFRQECIGVSCAINEKFLVVVHLSKPTGLWGRHDKLSYELPFTTKKSSVRVLEGDPFLKCVVVNTTKIFSKPNPRYFHFDGPDRNLKEPANTFDYVMTKEGEFVFLNDKLELCFFKNNQITRKSIPKDPYAQVNPNFGTFVKDGQQTFVFNMELNGRIFFRFYNITTDTFVDLNCPFQRAVLNTEFFVSPKYLVGIWDYQKDFYKVFRFDLKLQQLNLIRKIYIEDPRECFNFDFIQFFSEDRLIISTRKESCRAILKIYDLSINQILFKADVMENSIAVSDDYLAVAVPNKNNVFKGKLSVLSLQTLKWVIETKEDTHTLEFKVDSKYPHLAVSLHSTLKVWHPELMGIPTDNTVNTNDTDEDGNFN